MCVGAKIEQAKYMIKYDPSKWNEKAVVEIHSKSRLLFWFWVQEPRTIKRDFICRFGLKTSAQENLYKILMSQKNPLQSDILRVSLPKPESPGLCPEYPRTISGVSGHIPGVSGYPFTNGGVSGSQSGISVNNIRNIWIYTRSIRIPFHQRLVFGVKYPRTPLAIPLLSIFRAE
jgi:hypothetical protein